MRYILPMVALSIFAFSVAAFIGTTPAIQAHYQWYDSVNGDCEIRYEESTQYDSARREGERMWEALQGNNGCVEIAPDNANTSTDLKVKDVDKSNVTWAGYYNWWPVFTDRIRYNEHHMDDLSDCKKEFVAAHEWGHAQRLKHSLDDNIMHEYILNQCELGDHDEEDYREHWGNQ